MPRPTRDEVLAEIRGAALALFVERGYEATTLAQIAAAMGYSKSALLYHFESKEALLLATLEAPLSRLRSYLDATRGEAERVPVLVDLVLAHRDEAALLFQQGAKMAQIAPLAAAMEEVVADLVGDDGSVERLVAVHVALAGIVSAATELRDVDRAQLRELLVTAGTRVLGPPPA